VKRKSGEVKLRYKKWKVREEGRREERTTCVSEKEEGSELAWMKMIGAT